MHGHGDRKPLTNLFYSAPHVTLVPQGGLAQRMEVGVV